MFDCVKKFGQIITFSLSLLGAGIVIVSAGNAKEITSNADGEFTLNLNSENVPSNSQTAMEFVSKEFSREGVNYPLTFNYYKYQYSSGKHARILPNGYMFNYSSNEYNSRITSIKSINVDYSAVTGSGYLYLRAGLREDGLEWSDERVQLTSGQTLELNNFYDDVYYFKLEAPDSTAIDISNISIKYACETRNESMPLKDLGLKYSGKNSNTNLVWNLTRSSSSDTNAIISTNDKDSTSYSVSLSVVEGELSITFSDSSVMKSSISDDGITLSTTSTSGGFAANVGQLEWNKVFVVENFENYTKSGIGWGKTDYSGSMSSNWQNTNGLRGNYWVGTSANGDDSISGSFERVGSADTDYLNYKTDYFHSGSKSASLKASNEKSYFYSSLSNKLAPVNQIIGKGETFAFWARQKTTTLGTDSEDLNLKVYVYYSPDFDDAVAETAYATNNFVLGGADTAWSQYFVNLDPTKNVYGYSILVEKTSKCAKSFFHIDDVEIYTKNPNNTFDVFNTSNYTNPYISGIYTGTYKTKKGGGTTSSVSLKLGFSASTYCFLTVDGKVVNDATYTIDGNKFVVDANNYNSGQIKTLTGTFTNSSINVSSVTGKWNSTTTTNTLTKVNTSTIDFENSTYGMQNKLYWSYSTSGIAESVTATAYSGSNQLVSTHSDYLSGNCGLRAKVKGTKYTTFISLKNNVSSTTLNTFGFWVKNTTGKTIRFRLLVVTSQSVSGSTISYTFNKSQTVSVYFEIPSADHWQCVASTGMSVSKVINYGLSMYNVTDNNDCYLNISNIFVG